MKWIAVDAEVMWGAVDAEVNWVAVDAEVKWIAFEAEVKWVVVDPEGYIDGRTNQIIYFAKTNENKRIKNEHTLSPLLVSWILVDDWNLRLGEENAWY